MHTPVTAFYAGLLGILFFYYSVIVIRARLSNRVALGDGGDKSIQQVMRAHGNFTEYTPLILILLFVAEVNAGDPLYLHLAGSALLAGRFIHAFALRRYAGPSWQRVAGMSLTFLALIALSIMNILILY
ncbi:MAPEG family protein [Paraglaciecola aestuariivivens]